MSEHQSDIYQLINKTVAEQVDLTTKDLRGDIQDVKSLLQQYLMNLAQPRSPGRIIARHDLRADDTGHLLSAADREYITQILQNKQLKRRPVGIRKVEWHKTGHEGRQTRNMRAIFQPFDPNTSFPNLLLCANTRVTYRQFCQFLSSIEDENHEISVEKWIESKTGLQKEWNRQGIYKDAIINGGVSLERIGFLERVKNPNKKITFKFTSGSSLDKYLFDEDKVEDLPDNEILETQLFKANFPEDLSFLNDEEGMTGKRQKPRKRKSMDNELGSPDGSIVDADYGDSALATLASTSEEAYNPGSLELQRSTDSTPKRKRGKKNLPIDIIGKFKRGDQLFYKFNIGDEVVEKNLVEIPKQSNSKELFAAISKYEAQFCCPADELGERLIREIIPVVTGEDLLFSVKREGIEEYAVERYENICMTNAFKNYIGKALHQRPADDIPEVEFAEVAPTQGIAQAPTTEQPKSLKSVSFLYK